MNYGNPNHEAVLEAFHETQIRGFLVRGYYEIESQDHMIEKKYVILRSLQSLFEKYPNVLAGPMHPCNVTNDLLKRTKELSDSYGRKFYTHLAESEDDVQILVNREGKRDVELLDSLHILDSDFIGVHACNLKRGEIASLGNKKANTVHCATTNMYIADGVSPITELKRAGAHVSIGTDGAASTGRLDMFSEMKTAALLQKIHHLDPSKISARDILKMATVNGARALGIRSGMLKEGYLADILLLDMLQANTVVSQDPVSAIVYSADTRNVDTVIVEGKVLLKDKQFTSLDEDGILHTALEAASRLVNG
jgi:5-methylthioadenosine/S-adenosylhomocysteine deaminase